MKKLVLGFALVIGMIGNAQTMECTYKPMIEMEYFLLKKYNIQYMSPSARYIMANKLDNQLNLISKKQLNIAFDKFQIWNKNFIQNIPDPQNVIMMSDDFYCQEIFVSNCPITGFIHIPIDRDHIEYIEIVEYTQNFNNLIYYQFAILIKYENSPAQHYWDESIFNDCAQCVILN